MDMQTIVRFHYSTIIRTQVDGCTIVSGTLLFAPEQTKLVWQQPMCREPDMESAKKDGPTDQNAKKHVWHPPMAPMPDKSHVCLPFQSGGPDKNPRFRHDMHCRCPLLCDALPRTCKHKKTPGTRWPGVFSFLIQPAEPLMALLSSCRTPPAARPCSRH